MTKPPVSGRLQRTDGGAGSAARGTALPALLAEAHLLGEFRARLRVVRGDHRIVDRKAPFLAILLRGHVVLGPEVALERLELLPVLEADDVIWRHGLLHWH